MEHALHLNNVIHWAEYVNSHAVYAYNDCSRVGKRSARNKFYF